jgi:hypothetical protein
MTIFFSHFLSVSFSTTNASIMFQISRRLILHAIFFSCLSDTLALTVTFTGTNITRWSEDDWLEARFLTEKKFIFNRQQYEHFAIRTRLTEWSLLFSHGNSTRYNRIWTEFHVYLNQLHSSVKNICRSPVLSPLTNDSSVRVPDLIDMDSRIANYFLDETLFRTINYMHCTINERRRYPTIHFQLDIYLVTNRDFQSLLFIEMPMETQKFLIDFQARFYLRSHQKNFAYNFNMSIQTSPANNRTSTIYMMKLYEQTKLNSSCSTIRLTTLSMIMLLFFCMFSYLLISH